MERVLMDGKALGVIAIGIIIAMMAVTVSSDGGLPNGVVVRAEATLARFDDAGEAVEREAGEIERLLRDEGPLLSAAGVDARFEDARAEARQTIERGDAVRDRLRTLLEEDGRGEAAAVERTTRELAGIMTAAEAELGRVAAEARRLVEFKRRLPSELEALEEDYRRARDAELQEVRGVVASAVADWPGKREDLESRVAALVAIKDVAERAWTETAELRSVAEASPDEMTPGGFGRLEMLRRNMAGWAEDLVGGGERIRELVGQLDWSWDKVITDLVITEGAEVDFRVEYTTYYTKAVDTAGAGEGEDAGEGGSSSPATGAASGGEGYAVTTVALARQTAGTASADSEDLDLRREPRIESAAISQAEYERLKNNLGMTVEHKPAGKYDHEAEETTQPAGMAYIAEPGQRNRYGYWSGGFWVWYGQYAFMRDMFWGPRWRVGRDDWTDYNRHRRLGRTYYGGDGAAPRYGSSGTLTRSTPALASSRYVQSSGYRNTRYVQSGGTYRGSRYATRSGYRGGGRTGTTRSGGWGGSGSRSSFGFGGGK